MYDRPHDHCPNGCDHPQPFKIWIEGVCVAVCGCCAVRGGELVVMEPCTPEICH